MVQKVHPRDVIWVPSSRLMWADHQKNLTAVPSIHKEVHDQVCYILIFHKTEVQTVILGADPVEILIGTNGIIQKANKK